jgi:hypothetical protein
MSSFVLFSLLEMTFLYGPKFKIYPILKKNLYKTVCINCIRHDAIGYIFYSSPPSFHNSLINWFV